MTFRDEERPVNDISLASGTGCGERGDESAGNIPALAQEIILVERWCAPLAKWRGGRNHLRVVQGSMANQSSVLVSVRSDAVTTKDVLVVRVVTR